MNDDAIDVTGLGVASPLGRSVPGFWRTLLAGDAAWTPCTSAQVAMGAVFVGIATGTSTAELRRIKRHARTINRTFSLLLDAAAESAHDARLHEAAVPSERVGVVVGVGALDAYTDLHPSIANVREDGASPIDAMRAQLDPLRRLTHLPNIGASLLSIEHQAGGPATTLAGGHTSGLMAILEGHSLISEGTVDLVICGGADSRLEPGLLGQFGAITYLSRATDPSAACLPFHSPSAGTVASEGAAVVVLERHSSARRRGVRAYAELVGGWAVGSLSVRAVAEALDQTATLRKDAIGAIIAHGEGTPWLDEIELSACSAAFPRAHHRPQITSIKGQLGHTMSAAGAFNVVAGCLTIRDRAIPSVPPHVRPGMHLPFVIGSPRPLDTPSVIASALDPHGGAAAVLLARGSW